jgi:excisionase family DNA binding protein
MSHRHRQQRHAGRQRLKGRGRRQGGKHVARTNEGLEVTTMDHAFRQGPSPLPAAKTARRTAHPLGRSPRGPHPGTNHAAPNVPAAEHVRRLHENLRPRSAMRSVVRRVASHTPNEPTSATRLLVVRRMMTNSKPIETSRTRPRQRPNRLAVLHAAGPADCLSRLSSAQLRRQRSSDRAAHRPIRPPHPVPITGDRHPEASATDSAESQYVTGPEGLYRPEYVAKLWGVSRTKIFELIRTGRLRSLKIGGSRRIPESALAEYISRQSEGGLA